MTNRVCSVMTIVKSTRRVYAMLLAASFTIALLIRLTAMSATQCLLGFTFPGLRPSLTTATSVFLNNARLALVLFAFALVMSLGGTRGRSDPDVLARVACALMDAIVAAVVLLNVALVGASVGAYGARMVRTLLPHGPLEVLAYSIAISAYANARMGRRQHWRDLVLAGGACLVMLAVAAMVETYL